MTAIRSGRQANAEKRGQSDVRGGNERRGADRTARRHASMQWLAGRGFDILSALGGLTILRRVGRDAHREGRHGGHGMYVRNLTILARIAGDRQVACPAWRVAVPARTPARFAGGRRGERERSERVRSAWRVAGGVSLYARGSASAECPGVM